MEYHWLDSGEYSLDGAFDLCEFISAPVLEMAVDSFFRRVKHYDWTE